MYGIKCHFLHTEFQIFLAMWIQLQLKANFRCLFSRFRNLIEHNASMFARTQGHVVQGERSAQILADVLARVLFLVAKVIYFFVISLLINWIDMYMI